MRQEDEARLSQVDSLSGIGRKLLQLDAANAYSRLVVSDHRGNEAARSMLESISPRDLIDGPIASDDNAAAVMSGLWLRHDWLDESHQISQGIESETGSFWHAVMHRREGDFSNSKYWYRRTDGHPVFGPLGARASEVINPFPADKSVFRLIAGGWNSSALVDLVESVYDKPNDPRHRLAIMIQEIEWQTLFEHCTRAATGK